MEIRITFKNEQKDKFRYVTQYRLEDNNFLIEALDGQHTYKLDNIKSFIISEDVTKRLKAKWIMDGFEKCSNCGISREHQLWDDFCGNCGADMRENENE